MFTVCLQAISQLNEEAAGSKAAAELTGKQHHEAAARLLQAMKGKSTVSPSVKEKKLAGSTVTQPKPSSSSTGSLVSIKQILLVIKASFVL